MSGGGGSKEVTVGYYYYLGCDMALCVGPCDNILRVEVDGKYIYGGPSTIPPGLVFVNQPNAFGGESREGGVSGHMQFHTGHPTGTVQDPYLLTQIGNDVPYYKGIMRCVLHHMYVGLNPYLKNWSFLVKRIHRRGTSGELQWYNSKAEIGDGDMNPAHIIRELLTDDEYGMGYSDAEIDNTSFMAAADQLYAENFGLSFVWNRQTGIDEMLDVIRNHIDGSVYVDPITGLFAIRLMRDDYVEASLPVLDDDSIIKIVDFSKPDVAELVSSVTVKYWDRPTKSDSSITVQDIALAQTQGGVVSMTMDFPGITSREIANRVATRELKALSTPMISCKIHCDRTVAAGFVVGDVFKMSWSEYGVSNLVMRVINVQLGDQLRGTIVIDATQDIFALGEVVYSNPPDSGWTDPVNDPLPAPNRYVDEVPYYEIAQLLGDTDAQALGPTEGFLYIAARRPTSDAQNFTIWTSPTSGGTYTEQLAQDFVPIAELSQDVEELDTRFYFTSQVNYDQVSLNTHVLVENDSGEIEHVEVIAKTDTYIDVNRGCLDTRPHKHVVGARLWGIDVFGATDSVTRLTSETVYTKLVTRTGKGDLPIGSAPEDSHTFGQRKELPYVPGQFAINGIYFNPHQNGELTMSWAHRDRLQQTASLVDFTEGDIGPEGGTSYSYKFYDEDLTSIVKQDDFETANFIVYDNETMYPGLEPAGAFFHIQPGSSGGLPTTSKDPLESSVTVRSSFLSDLVTNTGQDGAFTASAGTLHITDEFHYRAGCARFPAAADNYIEYPAWTPGTGDFTIELKFKRESAGGNTYECLFARNDATLAGIYVKSDLTVTLYTSGGEQITSVTTIANDQWFHVCWERYLGVDYLYLDGVLVGSATIVAIANMDSTVRSGLGFTAGVGAERYHGLIDEVRVTTGTARYQAAFTPPTYDHDDQTLWWAEDQYYDYVSGTYYFENNTNDSGGFGHNGTPTAITYGATTTPHGSYAIFNGTSSQVLLPNDPMFQFGTGDYTIEFWFYPTTIAASSVISTRDAVGTAGLSIHLGNDAMLRYYYGAGSNTQMFTTVFAINTGYKITLCRRNGTIYGFVNGVKELEAAAPENVDSTVAMSLGSYAAGSTEYFAGRLDDVRITKGVGRYIADFDQPPHPPSSTRAYQDIFFDNVSCLYHLDGLNGATDLTDSVDNNNFNSLNGAAAVSTTASLYGGSSLGLTATHDYLRLESAAFEGVNDDWTIEFAVNFTSLNEADIWQKGVTDTERGIRIILNQPAANWVISLKVGDGTVPGYEVSIDSGTVVAATWYQVAAVKKGNDFMLFVDGVRQGVVNSAVTVSDELADIYVGANAVNATKSVTGYIDELRMTENLARYFNEKYPLIGSQFEDNLPYEDRFDSNVTSYLPMNEGEGATTFIDTKGNTWTTSGGVSGDESVKRWGKSSAFFAASTGTNLSTPNDANQFDPSGDFTFEAWVRSTSIGSHQAIISCYTDAFNNGFECGLFQSTFYIQMGTTAGITSARNAANILSSNTWYHVAATKCGNTIRTFVNGILDDETLIPGAGVNVVTSCFVGFNHVANYYFQGNIDEWQFSNKCRYVGDFTPPRPTSDKPTATGGFVPPSLITPALPNPNRRQTQVRVTLGSRRDGLSSLQNYDHVIDRHGYGYNYGNYYGGAV